MFKFNIFLKSAGIIFVTPFLHLFFLLPAMLFAPAQEKGCFYKPAALCPIYNLNVQVSDTRDDDSSKEDGEQKIYSK